MKKKYIIGLIILAILAFSTFWCYNHFSGLITPRPPSLSDSPGMVVTPLPPPPKTLYGLKKDSFILEEGRIKYAQNLATILSSHGVDYATVHNLAVASKDVFDLRRMKAGNPYMIFLEEKDSTTVPAWFVYEIDAIEYLVMSLKGDPVIYRDSKEVTTKRQTAVGIIQSSLWNTINDKNLNPNLALGLSDIFAWTVDFFGLEKGDHFTVIYDEQYVDSVSIGIGPIYATYFNHRKTPFYAFRYEQDSMMSFFDEEGVSLRKAFLKAPLKFSRISSRFSNSRLHPILKIRRPHHGVDYAAPTGTPVYALGDGRITRRAWDSKGGGNYIKIRHNSVYTTVYMHMSGFAKGISKGKLVKQSELIGYVGKTGLATGPHLDFRIYKNGKPTDPLKIVAPPVDPIAEKELPQYLEYIQQWKHELDSLTKNYTHPADSMIVHPAPAG
jgi:murein DD-endopeptidase MepM/ murein hydrolase activator NlpD